MCHSVGRNCTLSPPPPPHWQYLHANMCFVFFSFSWWTLHIKPETPPPHANTPLCCVFYGFPPCQVLISYKSSSISESTISVEQKTTTTHPLSRSLSQRRWVLPLLNSRVSVFTCIKRGSGRRALSPVLCKPLKSCCHDCVSPRTMIDC